MATPLHTIVQAPASFTQAEAAIARSVLYAALFEYPQTLGQLRQSLVGVTLTPSQILEAYRASPALAAVVDYREGFFFPAGRSDLLTVRRQREARSRLFLERHRLLLQIVAALPFVRMVALSGSIAHLNLEPSGDLDLFIVTRGRRVWSTAVTAVLAAKALGRRRTLCANLVVADHALAFEPRDLFTASQVVSLRPLVGHDLLQRVLDENPFVQEYYPNYHVAHARGLGLRQPRSVRGVKRVAEWLLAGPSLLLEAACRAAYGRYLRRRANRWQSPEGVTLGADVVKLHTRSHRARILREVSALKEPAPAP